MTMTVTTYETLLKISGTSTMQIKRIKQLAIEIFKTVNNLNPDFMKNIFTTTSKQNARVRPDFFFVCSSEYYPASPIDKLLSAMYLISSE